MTTLYHLENYLYRMKFFYINVYFKQNTTKTHFAVKASTRHFSQDHYNECQLHIEIDRQVRKWQRKSDHILLFELPKG